MVRSSVVIVTFLSLMMTCVVTFLMHPYCMCSNDTTGIQGVSWESLGAISANSIFGNSEKDHLFQSCLVKCSGLNLMNNYFRF